jgi:hypothetical protein
MIPVCAQNANGVEAFMQRLPVQLLEPGMVVAREVVNPNGIVLINADTELDERFIARLESMGVQKVMVKGCPVQLADYMPKTLEHKLEDMERAFSRFQEDSLMQKLRVLVKAHFIQREVERGGRVDLSERETPLDTAE